MMVEDLDLKVLAVETAEFAADPMRFIAEARSHHEWLATSSIGYVVTDQAAMSDIILLDGNLAMSVEAIVDIMGARDTGWGRFTLDMMLARSGSTHRRLRNSVARVFQPRSVNRMRSQMRSVVADLLDEWTPKRSFDFSEFAANFPIAVMFKIMGVSSERIPMIRSSLEIQGSSYALQPEMMPTIEAAYQTLWQFVESLIDARGPHGSENDLLDQLIAAHSSGELDAVELRQMLIFLFGAGYDTSKNQLTLIMAKMLENPSIWSRCARDREYCDKVVEEGFRFWSPSNIYRTVTAPFTYRGVTFPVGTMLFFPTAVAGQDDRNFADPQRFDPERGQRNRHIAFGRGMHICLGQFMARAQIEEAVHLIAQRFSNPRLAGEVTWRPFPGVWGIKSLPIAFDPAPPLTASLVGSS